MKRLARRIAALAGMLLLVCVGCRLATRDTYVAYIPVAGVEGLEPASVRVTVEAEDVVALGAPRVSGGYLRVPVRPRRQGSTAVSVEFGQEGLSAAGELRVDRFMTVYDASTGGFTGDGAVMVACTLFFLAVAGMMLRHFLRAAGPAFYAYGTVYTAGFSLFALLTGILLLFVTLRHLARPYEYDMLSAYRAISSAAYTFMMATAPFLLAFALAMAVSNAALLRHEPFSPKNVLGIGVGLALAAGEAVAVWLYRRELTGPARVVRLHEALRSTYATGFVYFECMLLGAVVCGLRAARHVPAMDADYILILGCKFRRDGTLTPLLRGRVDRAVDFWWEQRRRTGKQAVLMPCGGQGADEPMPEAEAMARYLAEKGVPSGAIRLEDRSRNTYQNMAFARALIEGERPGARVVYATTNYHVFRSGVWAALAGLPAEGMGSRTRWWYWPNAFMRECVGLLLNRVPQELALFAALLAFFGALSAALAS